MTSKGLRSAVMAGMTCAGLSLGSLPAIAQGDDPACRAPPPAFAADVKAALAGPVKGREQQQQRGEANLLELLNTCAAGTPPLAILFEQAKPMVNDPQAVLAMATILSATKAPWQAPDAATQEAWKARFYAASKDAKDDFTRFRLNAALMNADGLYRDAVAQLPKATPDKPNYAEVRKALRDSLAYPDSPNYDDAKFLLADLGLRELIFKRLQSVPALRPDAEIVAEAGKLLEELINQPRSKPAKYVLYGHWNQALMQMILGDVAKAQARLEDMKKAYEASLEENPELWNHTLYYYRPLHYPDFPPVNNHVTAIELYDRWKAASKRLQEGGTTFGNAAGIKALAAEVTSAFTNSSTYFVSLATVRTRKEAEAARAELQKTLPASAERGDLFIYPPWPERRLYSVGTRLMTFPEARAIVEKAGATLPKGTPITRFY